LNGNDGGILLVLAAPLFSIGERRRSLRHGRRAPP
jgi:hypothetical protein